MLKSWEITYKLNIYVIVLYILNIFGYIKIWGYTLKKNNI